MVKMTHGPGMTGPSSSLGIMRFFDVDTAGPKLTPEFVLGITVAFIVIILFLRMTIFH
jgi:preprotein translocase subunit Sec61beta